MTELKKIGLGGGCHWCTEAVFQSLIGVKKVEQGYISSTADNASFSEAVIVHYDPKIISSKTLLEIHLHTHHSASDHSFREKYRSAAYYFEPKEADRYTNILNELQQEFSEKIITQILPFEEFKASRASLRNYYKNDPEKPFCKRFIQPKLSLLKESFADWAK